MSKFTKPLVVLDVGERDPMIGVEDEFADGQNFCTVATTVTHGLISRDEAVRYAHLFAAAPDLRDALEALLPYFEGEHAYDHPDSVRARKALLKATPEQSDA